MDFWLTVRALGRRWYVALPTFVIVLAIAAFVALHTTHQYESTGTIVLSEPDPAAATKDHSIGTPVANPLLSFADSLTTSASLLIQSLNSPATQAAVAAEGGTATFTASDGKLTGPFIVVTADDPSPAHVQQTVALALRYAQTQLMQRQQSLGAPPRTYIVVKSVVEPTTPAAKIGGKTRFLGSLLILTLSATLCVTYAAETYGRRRQRLRAAQ